MGLRTFGTGHPVSFSSVDGQNHSAHPATHVNMWLMRTPTDYDRAYRRASQAAAKWVRDYHPDVWERLKVAAMQDEGSERRKPGRPPRNQ